MSTPASRTEASVEDRSLFKSEYGLYVDGAWTEGASTSHITQFNPATGEALAKIQAGTPEDAARAVEAAARALPSWSATTADQRQEILIEIANRLRARARDFALMESLNNGKTISEASFWDVPKSEEVFRFYSGIGHLLHGSTHDYPDAIHLLHREPIGVCAQIIPWNVPLLMAAVKIAPAIACGNTVVLKPAETTCLTVLEFIDEISDLIPPGVINVLTGYGAEVGEALVTHPEVRKVAFTGSTATGRKIIQYAAHNLIPQTLELGGKSAQIICPSANLDAAVEGAVMSTVFNKGEVCLAGSRLFVHNSIKEEFLVRLKAVIAKIRVGDPLNDATQLGALASQAQYNKVSSYLDLAVREGATPVAGGQLAAVKGLEKGFFVQPTIYDNVAPNMRIAQEEIFGPVSVVIGWSDEAEVLRHANNSTYGLAGGIWTRDLAQAHRIARALQTGTVWINRYYNFHVGMSLGGYKQSGFGRELSEEIIDAYTVTKSVVVGLADNPIGLFA